MTARAYDYSSVPKTGILETGILQNQVDLILQELTLEETFSGSVPNSLRIRIVFSADFNINQSHFILLKRQQMTKYYAPFKMLG